MQVAKGFEDILKLFFDLYGIGFFLVTTATGNYMSGYTYTIWIMY